MRDDYTMKKSRVILLAFFAFVLATWLYLRQSSGEVESVVVGLDGPVVDSIVFDLSEMNAADLYLEEQPDSRMTIRRMYYELDQAVSTSLFIQAMAEGVQFFITTQPSTLAVESRHLFTSGEALLINTSATSPLFTGQDDFILRIIPDAQAEQVMMAGLVRELHPRRLLILQDAGNPRYTDPAFRFFTNALQEAGGPEVVHRKLRVDDFSPDEYRELFAEPFDALYLLAGDFQVAIGGIAQFFHHHHPEAPIILTPWARSPMILETVGEAIDRIILPGHHPSRHEDADVGAYFERFRARFDYEPQAMALFVRQAMELLESAFAAGHTTPAAVKAFLLEGARHETSLGPVVFDAYGDFTGSFAVMTDVKRELLEP